MADIPTLTPPGTHLKDTYVPIDKYEVENLGFGAFAREKIIGLLLGTFAGSVAGNLAARALKVNRQLGGLVGGLIGGLVGGFRQWSKTNRRQLHVQNNLETVKEALDPDALKNEVTKEAAIIDDLQILEKKLAERSTSHGDAVSTRREGGQERQL